MSAVGRPFRFGDSLRLFAKQRGKNLAQETSYPD
jgi:hypothetical protein